MQLAERCGARPSGGEAWLQCIEVLEVQVQRRLALFSADRPIPKEASDYGGQVPPRDFTLRRPRQWARLLVVHLEE